MPQRDVYHDLVRAALIKDGWTITDDPLVVLFGERKLWVDLGAEVPITAERAGRTIAVEVKSFIGRSEIADLEQALGQYTLYAFLLKQSQPDRTLFLAVPEDTYTSLFDTAAGRDLVVGLQIPMIVFRPDEELVLQWKENLTERS